MWRTGGRGMLATTATGAGKDGDGGTANARNQLVVVCIDNDKNSQHALKWAADHVLAKGQLFVLLHIRKKIITIQTPSGQNVRITDVDDEVAAAFHEQVEAQTGEMLLPFRCFCTRRGLLSKEIILEDSDISKAILDYLAHNYVDKVVLGASSRSALLRSFRQPDVPIAVSKSAPDFCSVYVVSKGKISSVRPAPRPNKNPVSRSPSLNLKAEDDDVLNSPKSEHEFIPSREEVRLANPRIARNNLAHNTGIMPQLLNNRLNERLDRGRFTDNHLDMLHQNHSNSSMERHSLHDHLEANSKFHPHNYYYNNMDSGSDTSSASSLSSFDTGMNDMGYWSSTSSHGPGSGNSWTKQSLTPHGLGAHGYSKHPLALQDTGTHSWPKSGLVAPYEQGGQSWSKPTSTSSHLNGGKSWSRMPVQDVESEMQRLKLELQQKMEMYSSSSMDNMSAMQKTREFQSWKMEEELKIAEARKNEEAAMEMASREKQRCQAALQEVEVAKKAMEMETSKRLEAERKLLMGVEVKKWDHMSVDVPYRRYSVEEIEKATERFSESLKIGEGGYGPVYRSILDHTLVAIKVLRPDAAEGREQFQKEVEVLSRIRHPNMVLLLGACPEYGCLVYEYMANGSLEDCLFPKDSTPPLSWQLRFKIAAEIVTGLLFLHQTKPEPLVHRDLKPANILLDHNYVSKIGDVGLARLVPPSAADNTTQYCMTAAAGTFCYIDPEYQKTGMLGIKSDVYALGIILLQLLTGRPPMGLAFNVEAALERGGIADMLDPTVRDWPMEETLLFAKMALGCAELRRRDRPDLATMVLPELNRMRDMAIAAMTRTPQGHGNFTQLASHQEVINLESPLDSGSIRY